MFSFCSFLLATAAFATVASAIPTPHTSTSVTNIPGGLNSGKILPAGLPSAPHRRDANIVAEADVDARDIQPADMSFKRRQDWDANIAARADVDEPQGDNLLSIHVKAINDFTFM